MYVLNITKAIKTMSINEVKNFIFENFYKQIGFSKESSYYLMKRLNKKRFIVVRYQINKEKYLILVMLKNTINHLQ